MATTRERTVEEVKNDWLDMFNFVKAELSTDEMRQMQAQMTSARPGVDMDVMAYANLVNSSLSVSSVLAQNDRAAAQIAESLTRGRTRPRDDV